MTFVFTEVVMKKKIWIVLLSLVTVLCLAFGISACSRDDGNASPVTDFTFEKNGNGYVVVKYIGEDETVTIPSTYEGEPVIAIGESAFQYRGGLTSVTIPDSVTSIGDYAFA